MRELRANDPERERLILSAGDAAYVSGYALAHPYPPMMAACVTTFVNSIATPTPTPAQLQARAGAARVLWMLGCREAPLEDEQGRGGYRIDEQIDMLDQYDVIERPIRALACMGQGSMRLVHHLPAHDFRGTPLPDRLNFGRCLRDLREGSH